MGKIDKAILTLSRLQSNQQVYTRTDARIGLLLTLAYLGIMLSVPLTHLQTLILFGIYPIAASADVEGGYARVFKASLVVVPFIAMIGIFNPILDRRVEINVFGLYISEGWITFIAIIARGLFSVQALLILIFNHGFYGICNAMTRLKVPGVLTNQLMMVYRYLQVFLQEILTMKRAREARSFDGSHRLSLKMWGTLIGQLLIRTTDRAKAIHMAMLARGFRGEIPLGHNVKTSVKTKSIIVTLLWILIFIVIRIFL